MKLRRGSEDVGKWRGTGGGVAYDPSFWGTRRIRHTLVGQITLLHQCNWTDGTGGSNRGGGWLLLLFLVTNKDSVDLPRSLMRPNLLVGGANCSVAPVMPVGKKKRMKSSVKCLFATLNSIVFQPPRQLTVTLARNLQPHKPNEHPEIFFQVTCLQ